jgi:heptosyltransferase-2
MGDAILCTPALRAVRQYFNTGRISFLARPSIRETLSPCPFTDEWIDLSGDNPLAVARQLSKHTFTHALLFKNSFGSALATCLAGVPSRIGYRREGRGFLLTERLSPVRSPGGGYAPVSMVDYYLAIASRLGADTTNRDLELHVDPHAVETARTKVPEVFETDRPVVILVPGGAFGPSKCWPSENFAQTADWLIDNYGAAVVLSVSSSDFERQIAKDIDDASRHSLINLAERPVDIGQLKALFSRASLVISNDTGPRHIAIALQRKVITLFGPNDPAWTDTGYRNEVQIVSQAPCAPCQKPKCRKKDQVCMRDITPAQVCEAARSLLHTGD